MIKADDLKLHNLVRVCEDNWRIKKGTICEILGIDLFHKDCSELNWVTVSNPNSYIRKVRLRCTDIEGIPFSIKFLTKNGFKETEHRIDRSGYEWCTYENENSCVRVEYYPKTKDFSTFVGEEELCYITHVHELQNILSVFKENIEITI